MIEPKVLKTLQASSARHRSPTMKLAWLSFQVISAADAGSRSAILFALQVFPKLPLLFVKLISSESCCDGNVVCEIPGSFYSALEILIHGHSHSTKGPHYTKEVHAP